MLVYTREPGGAWVQRRLLGPDETIGIPDTNATLTLRELYEGVPVETATAAREA